ALTDIYAVGATARTLLAHQPYEPPPRLKEFVDRATSPNPAHRPQSAWAALKMLTGRKAPIEAASTGRKKRAPASLSRGLSDTLLRLLNGAVAGWLGYTLVFEVLGRGGAEAAGIAAGFGVLGYLLPRVAALGVIVALAVILLQSGTAGLGVATLLPVVGGLWVGGAGTASGDVARLPFGPLLAVPLSLVGLGAGLPFLMGALMRPLGATLSAAAGALALIFYEITLGDGVIPFVGGPFREMSVFAGPLELLEHAGRVLTVVPQTLSMVVLWTAMAAAVSVFEWTGRWFVGLALAAGGGALGYALFVSDSPQLLNEAMISLGLAAIMYGVLRYLASRARG
ncbi:MAG: hypothetical protein AB1425_07400, partial [Actinomycetota bacterium]